MKAMVLSAPGPIAGAPLKLLDIPIPVPGPREVLIRVEVCGVCRTDLHVAEGDLPPHKDQVVPGHEVVGTVAQTGLTAKRFHVGDRVGAAWLHRTDESCRYCRRGDENLCDNPQFTGYDVNGGYAEYMTAPEDYLYDIPAGVSSREAAPFLCAGIIGYRALARSGVGKGDPLGLYGFGGSAHVVIQIARFWECEVYVCTRGERHQQLAREMGAAWVGPADVVPPKKLRGAILFAPVGDLVPPALAALDKGGALAVAGIYLTPIPELDYAKHLFEERDLRSVTANTRADGRALMELAAQVPLHTHTREFPLEEANQALEMLKRDDINGAAVLRVSEPATP
jgi:propanol-preferring alcohol dehydrogenase